MLFSTPLSPSCEEGVGGPIKGLAMLCGMGPPGYSLLIGSAWGRLLGGTTILFPIHHADDADSIFVRHVLGSRTNQDFEAGEMLQIVRKLFIVG